jgi:hypothetical protein
MPKESALAKVREFNQTTAKQQPVAAQPNPQDPHVEARRNLYSQTRQEGQPKERALQRVHEYNWAVQQGLAADRALQFANTLEFKDQPKKVLTDAEKATYAQQEAQAREERLKKLKASPKDIVFSPLLSPSTALQTFKDLTPWKTSAETGKEAADAYAYARSKGWTEQQAQDYAHSTAVGKLATRLSDAAGDKIDTFAGWLGKKIGYEGLQKRAENAGQWGMSDETTRFLRYGVESGKMAGVSINEAFPLLSAITGGKAGNAVAKWLGSSNSMTAKVVQSLDRHVLNLAGGLLDPQNVALMTATMGEAALEELAGKVGIDEIPVLFKQSARTIQQLAHIGFTAQMAEGSKESVKALWNAGKEGNVPEVIGYALDALANGAMATAGIKEGVAHTELSRALDKTTEQVFGKVQEPTGEGPTQQPAKKFGDLNDYQQAVVITKLVETSPEYKEAMEASDAEATRAAKALAHKQSAALAQAWNPKAAARAIEMIHGHRVEGAAIDAERQRNRTILEGITAIREQGEQQRREAANARPQRRQQAAEERSEVGRVASSIADSREAVWKQRNEAQREPATETPTRHVETDVDAEGNVSYPAHYWGEGNNFGVAGDETGHAVYRQTPRGVEWLDASGNFTEQPEEPYRSPDPETADTVARLTALSANASTLAEEEGATPDHIKEADELSGIRRDLLSGEIDAREAQRRAGIAEKATVPDEYTAARDGRLNGPYHDSSAAEYHDSLREQAEAAGLTEEETNAILDNAGIVAEQQTKSNLNHVYRPGDYVISKRGVKWTLDSKGMLYPNDGGSPVPLMKRGVYSNDAMQLAQSGRVGYGTMTREERRLADSRKRAAMDDIKANQEAVDHEMRLAVQREGLVPAAESEPRGDAEGKQARKSRLMSRPPKRPESAVGQIVRMVLKAPSDAKSVIQMGAARTGVTPEEYMRLQLANDPERSQTPEAKVARLEVGDTVSDAFRPGKPWVVEQGKDGKLVLRSGNASPLPLDRLNPSDRVRKLVEKASITSEKPEFTENDEERAAFEKPHYFDWQKKQTEAVQARMEKPVVVPRNEKQAKVQAVAAERRSTAATAVAIRAVEESLSPAATDSAEQAEAKVDEATKAVELAKEARAQEIEAKTATMPKGDFPQRAQISIGMRGTDGVIEQNNRQFKYHYELVPLDSITMSHVWNGDNLESNPDFFKPLQPREPKPAQVLQQRLDAQRFVVGDDGTTSGYNFAKYANQTIDAMSGPPVLEQGGQTVSGNGRLRRLAKHIEVLNEIGDPEEREASLLSLKSAMRDLAKKSGIEGYPNDGRTYAVVRMLDDPIETEAKASELGLFFNTSEADHIGEGAKGVVYGRTLTDDIIKRIGRIAEASEGGLEAAMREDPAYFTQLVSEKFGIPDSQRSEWFTTNRLGEPMLTEAGARQFRRAVKGYVVKDTSVIDRIEGSVADRAFERALGYIVQMRAFPELDLSGKITEALHAVGETLTTDPSLAASRDKWEATYNPGQGDMFESADDVPPEPDRVVETLWRALHASSAASPRIFSDRLKNLLSDETVQGGMFGDAKIETPAEKFNRVFRGEIKEVNEMRGDTTRGISEEEFTQALQNRELSDVEREDLENSKEKGGRGESPEPVEPLSAKQLKFSISGDYLELTGTQAATVGRELGLTIMKHRTTGEPHIGFPNHSKAAYFKELAAKGYSVEVNGKAEPTGKMELPPSPPSKAETAARNLAETKKENGYVSPEKLKEFLETNPATKDHANELLRTARMMAEHVFDADPPIGVDRKDALDWVLRQRLAGIEAGELKGKRGEFAEERFAQGIMRLHKASDPSTFIHEFAHVIFPLLSDEDMKAIDSIGGPQGKRVWDGTRKGLGGDVYGALSEKLAHGMEAFMRDENPTGFTAEVKAVLAKVKAMMRKVYMAFAKDPLSDYENTEQSREVFAKMFGIADFDVKDQWRAELKKARAEEARMKKPSEEPHPLVKAAQAANADGIAVAYSGKVEDSVGERVDPKKPIAVYKFTNIEPAALYFSTIATEDSKIPGAEFIQGDDGTFGVRFNTKMKPPRDVLYQDEPERAMPTGKDGIELDDAIEYARQNEADTMLEEGLTIDGLGENEWKARINEGSKSDIYADNYGFTPKQWEEGLRRRGVVSGGKTTLYQESPGKLGLELEETKRKLEETRRTLASNPNFSKPIQDLLKTKIQNLENEIRSRYGVEDPAPQRNVEAAKQLLQEVKNGKGTDAVRKGVDGVSGLPRPPKFGEIPKPPTANSKDAAAGANRGVGRGVRVPTSLAEVTPVALQPLREERGQAVGTVVGEPFDQKAWVDTLKRAGLPETLPAPTWALSRKTADKLIFPGQKEVVQTALSALEQGDGAVVATSTGTGKCLGRGTPVLMFDGTVIPVEEVRVGDLLMGPDSKPRTVLSLAHGYDNMYRVVPVKGEAYEVNEPHILSLKMTPTGTNYPGGRARTINISVKDYISQGRTFKHRAKGYRVGVAFERQRVQLNPYILGMWLGDGTSCRASVTTADPEIRAFWEEYAESLGGWIRKDNVKPGCTEYTAVFSSLGQARKPNKLKDKLSALDLIENKHIPHIYKANDEQTRLELLAGLIDTDGSVSCGGYDFISKWERLADDVAYVARSLGFAAYVKPSWKVCTNTGKGGWYYRLHISGDVGRIPVRLWRKRIGMRQQKKNVLVTGIRVQPIGMGEYFGFEIDGDHLFLLGDFTVTHNTYSATAIISEFRGRNPEARILHITKNTGLLKDAQKVAAGTFGFDIENTVPDANAEPGVYGTTYGRIRSNDAAKNTKWDLVIADESGEARRWFDDDNKQGKALIAITANANKAVYFSATPFHAPMEYGYLTKLNLWEKGGFDKWIESNFAHEKVNDKIVARLDPGKQAKLRQQLIESGQLVSQAVSYDGFTAHFGVVPVTDSMKRGLDRIHEGFARAKAQLIALKKKGVAEKAAALEATYTKAFLERERLPQAIELAKKARANGWQVVIFSETSSEDLFRRPTDDPGTYQQLDTLMGGQLSRIIPAFPDVYQGLRAEFGEEIRDYSGRGNSNAEREKAKADFLSGEIPILYTTYAAGGIGVSLHDADYPDRGIKGGDKPRVAIFLGPPYSGVLLEQAMGRTWRFGVKSDTHAVFLATDSEPDIRLMQQKVGPRMRALRASVLGERDSLASAMASYSDEEKTRARQESLAYQEGNEEKLTASSFQVRSKNRNVGINDWSQIEFPTADSAKNKGMKYGEDVTGGDWSTLYQDKEKAWMQPPPTPESVAVDKAVDEVASKAAKNPDIPRADIALGAAQATETAAVAPKGIDKAVAAQMSMEGALSQAGYTQDPETGEWVGPHWLAKKMMGEDTEGIDERDTKYTIPTLGMSQEQRSIAAGRKIGAEPQVREVINTVKGYEQGVAAYRGELRTRLLDIFQNLDLDIHDEKVMDAVFNVVERKRVSANPKIIEAAAKVSDLMVHIRRLMGDKKVSFDTAVGGTGTYADVKDNPHHMPHVTDWEAKLTDTVTGDTKTLRQITDDNTLDEAKKLRYMEAKRKELGASEQTAREWLEDLKRDRKRLNGPKNPNVTMRRELNHPFYHRDIWALDNYINQVASAVSKEEHFGGDMRKLKTQLSRIPSQRLRTDLQSTIATMFEHQDWSTRVGKLIRHGQGFEAITKMILSPISVFFHGIHATLGLGGRVKPLAKAVLNAIAGRGEFMREKYYAGVVDQRMNPNLLEGGKGGAAGAYFKLSGFDGIYRWTRAIVGESANVWMKQDALPNLIKYAKMRESMPENAKATFKGEDETRRLLKNTMLIGDHAIDEAIRNGKWDEGSINKAQRSFADQIAFSDNPLQMPKLSRMSMAEGLTDAEKNWHAAARGMYMLQSFSIKTYSLLREKLYDEVVVHGNLKPLAPFLLLYPAAGAALFGLKSGVKGGLHRAGENLTGKKHEHDAWDTFLDEFKDMKKNPWLGPMKFYIDSLCTATGMESTKRWTDMAMMMTMKEDKKADNTIRYILLDELEQKVGGLYSDILQAGYTQGQAAYDYRHTKTEKKKLPAAERDEMREVEQLVPITKSVPWIDQVAHPMSRPPNRR